jgi:Ca-activated chloride channel family protein
MIKTLFVVGLVSVVATSLEGQAGRRDVNLGNRLFSEGRFDEARDQYLEALRAAPESPIARFNAANALYKTEDFQNALVEYQQALELGDPQLQALANYNLGNALFQQQDLEGSLEAFKQTLRLNPGDVDAKHNLERVLEQMQQQEEEQNQDGDPNDEDQEEQDPDQQNQDQQGDQNQDQQDPNEEQDPNEQEQPDPSQDQGDDQDQQQQPQETEGPPPQMTPEEVERLLQAVNEDPNEMRRQATARARPVKVKKDW